MGPRFKLAVAIAALMSAAGILFAQSRDDSDSNKVVLTQLFAPTYPRLARQTGITGDVELNLKVGNDGSIESVEAVSGHPLLRSAALDSAKRSNFRCLRCTEAAVSYRLVYTFEVADTRNCCQPNEVGFPKVSQSGNHITVIEAAICICDYVTAVRRRSIKCLYLWRCKIVHFE